MRSPPSSSPGPPMSSTTSPTGRSSSSGRADPTTPRRSSSPREGAAPSTSGPTSTTSTSSRRSTARDGRSSSPPRAAPSIRFADRIFCTGATGTGKSTVARSLFCSTAGPRLVVDPVDATLTRVPGAVTFRDPAKFPTDAPIARFVPAPDAAGDPEVYDELYRQAFARYPRFTWLDEAGMVAPAKGAPRWVRAYLTQGRKRQLGHLACHTRPRECDPNLISQAQHVLMWDLPNPDDRRRVAELVGIPPRELDAHLARLAPHGFLWWSQRDRTLTICPPVAV